MCQIKVLVVEESYHPPVIQGPQIFYIIVAPPYGWTKIGEVNVYDEDKSDMHQYRISGGNDENLFQIQPMTGVIEGKPVEGSYSVNVEVTDGKFTDDTVFKIVVNEFNEHLKTQSISVLLNGVDVPTFVNSKMVDFVKLVATLSGTISDNVFVWSILDVSRPKKAARKRRDTISKDSQVMVALAVKGIQNNVSFQ